MGMTEVLLYGVEPTEDERSMLRERVGNMHCVPLASVYAGYVAACLLRGEVAEGLDTFEARLRQYFLHGNDPGVWADRPIIFEGIVYGVWFDDKTRLFVVDPTPAATSGGAAWSDVAPPTTVRTAVTKPTPRRASMRGRRRDVSARTMSHTRETASSNPSEPKVTEGANA